MLRTIIYAALFVVAIHQPVVADVRQFDGKWEVFDITGETGVCFPPFWAKYKFEIKDRQLKFDNAKLAEVKLQIVANLTAEGKLYGTYEYFGKDWGTANGALQRDAGQGRWYSESQKCGGAWKVKRNSEN